MNTPATLPAIPETIRRRLMDIYILPAQEQAKAVSGVYQLSRMLSDPRYIDEFWDQPANEIVKRRESFAKLLSSMPRDNAKAVRELAREQGVCWLLGEPFTPES